MSDQLKNFVNRLRLIRAQDQGAGGNLTPQEIVTAMQRMLDDTIRELDPPALTHEQFAEVVAQRLIAGRVQEAQNLARDWLERRRK
jgi:hypothetical protein